MSQEAEQVFFTVEGEYLTNLGRSLMLEGNWEKALRILKTGLQGISTDQVISILSGDYALDGINDLRYFRKEDKEFKKKIDWLYAGYIRANIPGVSGEHWYRPYAVVTDYGPKDFHNPGAALQRCPDSPRRLKMDKKGRFEKYGRAMHYARNDTDLTACLKLETSLEDAVADGTLIVLFSRIESPPFWLTDEMLVRNKTPQDSVNDFLHQGRGLEDVGHHKWYGAEDLKERQEAKSLLETLRKKKSLGEKLARERERDEKKQEKALARRLIEIKEEVIKQAGDNWFEFKAGERTIRVPRAPFEHWVLSRTSGLHLALPWKPISPSGLKMINDDPYHSDWMLGAGLPIDAMAFNGDEELTKGAYRARNVIFDEKLGFKVDVLSGRGSTEDWKHVLHPHADETGLPGNAVIVLPSAHPKYLPLVAQITTGAIIVERGGSVAHLVNIAREREVRIVRIENALKLYPPGTRVKVDCEKGEVDVASW